MVVGGFFKFWFVSIVGFVRISFSVVLRVGLFIINILFLMLFFFIIY